MARVGRPRSFDKDDALKKAMYVFWEKGYEGTTMADLIASIGMKAPSIYAAFGNKDAIFKEVVECYLPIVVEGQLAALNSSSDIERAVDNTLKACVHLYTNPLNPHTCLIMTAAINAAPEHAEHVTALKKLRQAYHKAWEKRFQQAMRAHQLDEGVKPAELADFFTTLIQGMTIKARDGASKQALVKTTKIAMQTLRCYLSKKR